MSNVDYILADHFVKLKRSELHEKQKVPGGVSPL
jgi:hypothetical protein